MKTFTDGLLKPGRGGMVVLGLLLALAAGLAPAAAQSKVHLKVSAISLIPQSYKAWTAATPWDKVDKFDSPYANRQTVELILEMQALKAGGLDFDIEFVDAPHHGRAMSEVENGSADIAAETVWDADVNGQTMLKTDPVIRDGDFEKGLYALPSNDKALKAASADDVRALTGVTVANWTYDVEALRSLNLKAVEKSPSQESSFEMIQKGRADLTLLEFTANADMSTEMNGIKLAPIPNFKVVLHGSRSWIVSKASPQAQPVYAALAKGVKALRDNGLIERAFKESGFINARVGAWKRLN